MLILYFLLCLVPCCGICLLKLGNYCEQQTHLVKLECTYVEAVGKQRTWSFNDILECWLPKRKICAFGSRALMKA